MPFLISSFSRWLRLKFKGNTEIYFASLHNSRHDGFDRGSEPGKLAPIGAVIPVCSLAFEALGKQVFERKAGLLFQRVNMFRFKKIKRVNQLNE